MTGCFKFKDTFLTPLVEIDGKTEGGELTILGLTNLFHSAYLNYCYEKQADVELVYDQVAEWLDEKYKTEEGQQEIAKALEVWAQSKEVKKLKEDVEKKSLESLPNQISTTLTQPLQES